MNVKKQPEEKINKIEIEEEQRKVILEIFEWVKRMSKTYGPIVKSIENKEYDWGQALCREQFGEDWQNYMITNHILMPTKKDLERALDWEKGNKPYWIKD